MVGHPATTLQAGCGRMRILAVLLGYALRWSEVAALTDGRRSGGFPPEATAAARRANTPRRCVCRACDFPTALRRAPCGFAARRGVLGVCLVADHGGHPQNVPVLGTVFSRERGQKRCVSRLCSRRQTARTGELSVYPTSRPSTKCVLDGQLTWTDFTGSIAVRAPPNPRSQSVYI